MEVNRKKIKGIRPRDALKTSTREETEKATVKIAVGHGTCHGLAIHRVTVT